MAAIVKSMPLFSQGITVKHKINDLGELSNAKERIKDLYCVWNH